MKRFLLIIIAVIFITIFIPLAVVMLMNRFIDNSVPYSSPETAKQVKVYFHSSDTTEDMDVRSYLIGVTAAEMPAEFETEALKAQAVAARTYLASHTPGAHNGADICTDSTHCQAWISEEKFKSVNSDELWNKIVNAVSSTENEIITYKGKPISAVFFSSSPGITENAEDVWGKAVPYLKSVKSLGDNNAPNYRSELTLSTAEFKRIAEENIENVTWDNALFDSIEYTKADSIKALKIGGISVKGTELRSFYGLRSTNVTISISDENVNFSVIGHGHNVGMSQYGANYMALQGSSYKDILQHYYSGIKIEKR